MFKILLLIFFLSVPFLIVQAQESSFDEPESAMPDLKVQAEQIKKAILTGNPKFTLIGTLEKGTKADYSINGEDLVVDSNARIVGNLKLGASVSARGDRIGDRNYAKVILVGDPSSKPSKKDPSEKESDSALVGSSGPKGLPGQKLQN